MDISEHRAIPTEKLDSEFGLWTRQGSICKCLALMRVLSYYSVWLVSLPNTERRELVTVRFHAVSS